MALQTPRSPIPWIALFVGAAFALIATFGALAIMAAPVDEPQLRMTFVPPQVDAPRLPDPLIPMPS